jgi:hypothetical protein
LNVAISSSQPGFYVAGGTLRGDAPSYVVRDADRILHAALQRGEICYALTPRQMGKSSLMVRTAARLRDEGTLVAVLDLTALGQNLVPLQWYNGLLEKIGQQLQLESELEDFWESLERLGPLQRWMAAIREGVLTASRSQVVIFVDEIDAVRSLPFSTDEFFAGIRELYNRRANDAELSRLTFCLLGVATPSDLIRDIRTTPFNVGRRIELADFSRLEAAPLARGLGRDEHEGEQLLARILYWTGGHPYLTQRLCQAVAESSGSSSRHVDEICGELFLSHRARERDDNLLFVRERLLRSEVDVGGLLSHYAKIRSGKRVPDDETNRFTTVLRLSGITRVENGELKVRNPVYSQVFDQDWVAANLPGAEVRRQRAAYLRGVRIASLATMVLMLLAAGYGLWTLFNTDISLRTRPPAPALPVFWASSAQISTPEPTLGSILIKTSADSVSVMINNVEYGRTGRDGTLRVPLLQVGSYSIQLRKPGFQSVSEMVRIAPRHETIMMSKLQPQSQLLVETWLGIEAAPPGATVKLDGKLLGVVGADGSLMAKISPGLHSVELDSLGYLPKTVTQQFGIGNTVIAGALAPDIEARDWESLRNSDDPSAIESFVTRYPQGRFAGAARARTEELRWDGVKDSTDEVALNNFLESFPHSEHNSEARASLVRLQKEDLDWHAAQDAHTSAALESFLELYSQGRYSRQARTRLDFLLQREAILRVLSEFQDSYNRKDLRRVLSVWPDCPSSVQRTLRDEFKNDASGVLNLSMPGDPRIEGDIATATVTRTRQTQSATASGNTQFSFRRKNQHWLIQKGAF